MSFSGKRYKRTRHENMEELLQLTNTFGDAMRFLQNNAPIFCFTKTGDNTFNYILEAEGKHISFNFTLGEEKEVERRDGEKFHDLLSSGLSLEEGIRNNVIKILFTMPNENVLKQVIKIGDGKVANFVREFYGNESKTIVTMDGWNDKQGIIYFEVVE